LPELTAALAADELAFSAVRELTRVATPGTEAAWIRRAQVTDRPPLTGRPGDLTRPVSSGRAPASTSGWASTSPSCRAPTDTQAEQGRVSPAAVEK
jgi:hypothetical protein